MNAYAYAMGQHSGGSVSDDEVSDNECGDRAMDQKDDNIVLHVSQVVYL